MSLEETFSISINAKEAGIILDALSSSEGRVFIMVNEEKDEKVLFSDRMKVGTKILNALGIDLDLTEASQPKDKVSEEIDDSVLKLALSGLEFNN